MPVRVKTIGDTNGANVLIEFCGATHIRNIGNAKAFVIVEETPVAEGIRQIIVVTILLLLKLFKRVLN